MYIRTDKQPMPALTDRRAEPGADAGSLLIVDNDRSLVVRLVRDLEQRGFAVITAESISESLQVISGRAPDYVIVETRLSDGNGLDVITALKRRRPDTRAVVLTGYGNIASAVTAIKRGASDYLPKPVDFEELHAALRGETDGKPLIAEKPMSADRVRWEHIQRVFEACDRNVSETARRLNMHRRTLQRILAKRAPR
jgi:two-component system response regulator RegA